MSNAAFRELIRNREVDLMVWGMHEFELGLAARKDGGLAFFCAIRPILVGVLESVFNLSAVDASDVLSVVESAKRREFEARRPVRAAAVRAVSEKAKKVKKVKKAELKERHRQRSRTEEKETRPQARTGFRDAVIANEHNRIRREHLKALKMHADAKVDGSVSRKAA